MKIALVGPFPPYRGGIAQFGHMLSVTLGRLFPHHELLRISFNRLYPSLLFPGTTQLEPEAETNHEETHGLIDSCNPLAWMEARRTIEDMNPDRLIVQWWHPFFAPSLIASLPGDIPAAAVCHNVLPHEPFPFSSLLAGRFFGKMELAVVHSETEVESFERLGPDTRILKLYHPVYNQYGRPGMGRREARMRLGYGEDTVLLLFFGLVRSYKGIPDLLAAMKLLPDEVNLLIVGESYSGREETAKEIASPELASRVRWIDRFIPDDDVHLFFEAADVVVLPYRQASQSGVAQVALSFGKVMVLTRVGGLPELVDEGSTGFLAKPGSPGSLANAVMDSLKLISDPDTKARVAKKASSLGWDEYLRALMKALE